MSLDFKHIQRIGDEPRLFAFVLIAFAEEQAAGNYPAGRRVPNGDEQCWIVLDDEMPVAFATHYVPDNTGMMWLDLLFVEESHRRHGIGAELVALVESKGWEQSCNRVEWGTGTGNEAMNSLSSKGDAQMIGHYYRKDLNPSDRAVEPRKAA